MLYCRYSCYTRNVWLSLSRGIHADNDLKHVPHKVFLSFALGQAADFHQQGLSIRWLLYSLHLKDTILRQEALRPVIRCMFEVSEASLGHFDPLLHKIAALNRLKPIHGSEHQCFVTACTGLLFSFSDGFCGFVCDHVFGGT